MRLSLHSDYALRILMALAATGQQMSVDEIASHYGISRNHLAKVAQRLQTLGYVSAQRGRGGGLTLARAPSEVIAGTVVREFENLGGLVECMDPATSTCPVRGGCGLQGALGGALAAFLAHLDRYTLADLLPQPARFRALLGAE
ncbi:RrF2 family transcriptional regulator [Sphingopyxis sp. FD7]|jgi:Rrf2 family nitric oxide-sensitive transcriptional repressor|uniref:RrF2 family transcriptional regulator n=1 Tax=Sphingopyxis sp. FD7 TaxID=1914525 RepID=UPI000DC61FB0|nr:Rrf2 family transcriptional regulator [Sphingopyxis sp. FD7]BBB11611.1 BadM/Rrf2 family transcriptional regulator [Sphingopyxis sp. FD7]